MKISSNRSLRFISDSFPFLILYLYIALYPLPLMLVILIDGAGFLSIWHFLLRSELDARCLRGRSIGDLEDIPGPGW